MKPELLAVYVILDPDHCRGRSLPDLARQAVQGGATVIQLRAEGRTTYEQLSLAQALRAVTRALHVPLIINDRVDVALAVEADGVHVGHAGVEDMPPDVARRLLGPQAIIGVSVATPAEAVTTARLGADYFSIGPIYSTATKGDAGPAVGLERLTAIRAVVTHPLCAIGSVTATNAGLAMSAGADGVAVISAVTMAPDPTAATRALVVAVAAARRERESTCR